MGVYIRPQGSSNAFVFQNANRCNKQNFGCNKHTFTGLLLQIYLAAAKLAVNIAMKTCLLHINWKDNLFIVNIRNTSWFIATKPYN